MRKKLNQVEFLRTIIAITIALLIIFVVIFIVSDQPLIALRSILVGPLLSVRRFGNVIELMIPLIFVGLATIVMFRVGLFNLSVEGAMFVGIVVAAILGIVLKTPPVLTIIIAMLAAGLISGLMTMIPGFLKVKFSANEIVTSLMLNYVLLNIGLFVIQTYFRDYTISSFYSYKFQEGVVLPNLISGTRIHLGIILAVIAVFLVHLLLEKTSFGYKSKLVGANSKMAKYSGIKNAAIIVGAQFIGGVLAGVGGSAELFGLYQRFQYQDLIGYGWDGILIAIVARHKPKHVPLAAFFIAYLRIGADVMALQTDVPFEIIKIIQAIVIVLISAQAILAKYRKNVLIKEVDILENKVVDYE